MLFHWVFHLHPSTDSRTETGTFDGLLTNTVLPSTLNTDILTQPLTELASSGLPLTVSLNLSVDGWDTSHPCTPTVVPEPASIILFGTGLTALATRLRHRRRRQDA